MLYTMRLTHLFRGTLHHAGEFDAPNVLPSYGEGDSILVVFDAENRTIKFARNFGPQILAFDNVAGYNLRPCVLFYHTSNFGETVSYISFVHFN